MLCVLWPHVSLAPSSLQPAGTALQDAFTRACVQHGMDTPRPLTGSGSQGTISSNPCSRAYEWLPSNSSPPVESQEHTPYGQFAKISKLNFPPQHNNRPSSSLPPQHQTHPQSQFTPPIKHPHPVKLCTVSVSNCQVGAVGKSCLGCRALRGALSTTASADTPWVQTLWQGQQAGGWPGGQDRHCPTHLVHSPSSMGLGPAGPAWGAGPTMASSCTGAEWRWGEQRVAGKVGGLATRGPGSGVGARSSGCCR